jgi:hypothetical protein
MDVVTHAVTKDFVCVARRDAAVRVRVAAYVGQFAIVRADSLKGRIGKIAFLPAYAGMAVAAVRRAAVVRAHVVVDSVAVVAGFFAGFDDAVAATRG